jgi:hypothetical protein
MLMLWGRRRLKLEVSSHLEGGNWMRGAWKGCIIEVERNDQRAKSKGELKQQRNL